MATKKCPTGSRRSASGKTCQKTRGKTKRYSINYSRVFGKKKKK
jgi:hypothetical protein